MPTPAASDSVDALEPGALAAILEHGALELVGRLVAASNASFLGTVTLDGVGVECIYKPVRGERPLWDFPTGTLASRERAAYLLSELGDWHVVPHTVLRDGDFGPGMVQRWIDTDDDAALLEVVAPGAVPDGWIAILEAEDEDGDRVLLVHPDDDRLRELAVFDVVVNNADRKGGHLLPLAGGPVLGCDHGVTFHHEPKLRTVLWGWADQALRDTDRARLEDLAGGLRDAGTTAELVTLLDPVEVRALRRRIRRLLADGQMPSPTGRWPAIPWPAW